MPSGYVAPAAAQGRVNRESWLIGGVALVLFTLGLWQQPFTGFDSRFALFAQEMLRHGLSLFPTTYGAPYPDYPVTGTLLIALFSLPFGAVTKLSATLPTALAAALNCVILYRLLAPHSRQWAVLALCLQLMTATFIFEARSISLDQMVATLTLLGFYLAYEADRSQRPRLRRWLPLVLLIGFLVRGPLGVVIPAGVVVSFYAIGGQWRVLLRFGLVAALLLAVCWLTQLGLAAGLYGEDFMREVVRMQVAGRLEAKSAPEPLYYFTSSFGNYALAYPLAIITALLLARSLRPRMDSAALQLVVFCLAWALLVLIGLSVPHTKKARYVLAMVPALSVIAAYPWLDANRRALRWLRQALEILFAALPLLLIVALAVIYPHFPDAVRVSPLPAYIALALLQIGVLAARLRLPASRRGVAYALVAALSVWVSLVLIVEPVTQRQHDSSSFVAAVEAAREQKPGALALYGITQDGAAIKYLVNTPYDIKPVFVRDFADVAALPRPAYLVIGKNIFIGKSLLTAFPDATPVADGRFNNSDFVALYLP